MEPKHIDEETQDDNWVKAMQEELDQFWKNDVRKLVKLPKGKKAMRAKWVFRNKLDEDGKLVRNKARLVVKGYSQLEGIDYIETFAPIA